MDKNTFLGLLMMMAVIFGFMYFNRPSEEQIAEQRVRQEAQAKVANDTQDKAVTPNFDTLSLAERQDLVNAVKITGTHTPGQGYRYTAGSLDLKVDENDALSGTVCAGSDTIDLADVINPASALDFDRRTRIATDLRALSAKALKYRGFARYLGGDEDLVVLENSVLKLTLNTHGGYISSAVLKNYNTELTEPPTPIELFHGSADGYGFRFIANEQRIDTRDLYFTPALEGDSVVTMAISPAQGAMWGIRYTLRPDSYVVGMEIVQHGLDGILPASTVSIDMDWHQKMGRNEKGRTFEERNSGIYYKYVGDSPDDINANKDAKKEISGRIKWVAYKNQFFSSVLIARDQMSTANLSSVVINDKDYLKDLNMVATAPYTAADGVALGFDFFLGPNEYPLLKSIDKQIGAGEKLQLTRMIPLGWSLFRWINTLIIIPIFTFLGHYIHNYGIIILLLTIFIKLIIFPFTFKSFTSQARMRVLQPEIKEINEKYPGPENAAKRSQETMSLYSRVGASPFSGCLPMLLQMPVLIAMFSFFPSAIELRGQSFLWAHDLSAPDSILTLPFTIPFYGNHVSLFCLLMTVVNVIYMHVNMQNQPGGDQMPGMKWMMYLMPVMFLFFFNDYASGLSYYYFLSLLITIVQTWIFRKVINEDKVRAELLANAKKPKKKSGLMARLEAAQKQQEAMMRQQAREQAKRRR